MGLTAEALWRLTPREYEALSERYLSWQRRQDELWARNAAQLHNLGRPERAAQIEDFMPGGHVHVPNPEHARIATMIAAKLAAPIKMEDVPDWAKRPSVH